MGGLLARPACEAAVAGFPYDHYWTVRNFRGFGGLGRLARNLRHANKSPRKFSCLENVTNVHNQWINIVVWTNFAEKNMIQSKALTPRLNRCEALAFLWFHQRICQAPSPQFAAAVCEETCKKVLLRQDSVAVEMFVHPVLALPQSNRRSTMKAYITVIPIGWG